MSSTPDPGTILPDPLPAMPTEHLPPVVRVHVRAVSEAHQVPSDLVLLLDLGALAIAAQGLAVVRIGPDWVEQLALFTMTSMASGERKSAAAHEVAAPLWRFEAEQAAAIRADVCRQSALHAALLKRLEQATNQVAKAKDGPDRDVAEAALEDVATEVAGSSPGVLPRILADDVTPEALVGLLADHGQIGIVSAEGGLFDTLAGRYSNQIANLDAILKAFGGEPILVDRRGREPERVARPLVSLALAVQPDVIEGAMRNTAMVGRGFLSRFLMSVPTSKVGYRDLHPPHVPETVRAEWERCLVSLLSARGPRHESRERPSATSARPCEAREMLLTNAATAEFDKFRMEVEHALRSTTGLYRDVRTCASKAPALAVRIAALLHLAERGPDGIESDIEERSIRAGCDIVRAHLGHVLRLLGVGEDTKRAVMAQVVHRWALEKEVWEATERDVLEGCKGRSNGPTTAAETRAALEILRARGLADRAPAPLPTGGRPASPSWGFFDTPSGHGSPDGNHILDGAEQAAHDVREMNGEWGGGER